MSGLLALTLVCIQQPAQATECSAGETCGDSVLGDIQQEETGLGGSETVLFSDVLHGDFVAVGESTRIWRAGHGDIYQIDPLELVLQGIPEGATLVGAYANWSYQTYAPDSQTPAQIVINDTPVSGVLTGEATPALCWRWRFEGDWDYYTFTVTFSADVTDIVTNAGGNGTYVIGGVVDDPVAHALAEGISLLVVYEKAGEPLREIKVYSGLTQNTSNSDEFYTKGDLDLGVNPYIGGPVHLFINTLDGEMLENGHWPDRLTINGIQADGFPGTAHITTFSDPDVWQGALGPGEGESPEERSFMYDHADGDASPFMRPDDDLIAIRSGLDGGGDCLGHSFAAVSFVSLDWCDDGPPGEEFDCDDNDVPDICDIYFGTSADCNGNWIPDECDIEDATSEDCQCPPNGVPDECDVGLGEVTFEDPTVYSVLPYPSGVTATAKTADDETVGLDVDGDGDTDLVVCHHSSSSNNLTVLWNDGAGGFGTSYTTRLTGLAPYRAAAGDFDVDGDYDLAVSRGDDNEGQVTILLNHGVDPSPPHAWLGFSEPTNVAVGSDPKSIVCADLDSDGDLDLATANEDSGNVSVLYNSGTGTFVANPPFPVGENTSSSNDVYGIVVGDLDGDGLRDLAAADKAEDVVGVLINTGGQDGSLDFGTSSSYYVGTGNPDPKSLALADFDRDGYLDIVSANYNSGTLGVLLNKGGDPWEGLDLDEEYRIAAGLVPECVMKPGFVMAPDLDTDGFRDVLVTHHIYEYFWATTTVFVNQGDEEGMALGGPTWGNFAYPSEVEHATTGDFNGDDVLDIAIACNDYDGEVWVSLNSTGAPASHDYNPPNGIPDECECPDATEFTPTPADGVIDARIPHPPTATTPCYGFGMPDDPGHAGDESLLYPIVIDIGGIDQAGADENCWELCETPDMSGSPCGSNSIASVTDNADGTYTIALAHGVAAGAVTTIQYADDDYISYIHQPGDADGSGRTSPYDITVVVDCLNASGTCENYEADIDASGTQSAADIVEEVCLLSGEGSYAPWGNTDAPENTGACPVYCEGRGGDDGGGEGGGDDRGTLSAPEVEGDEPPFGPWYAEFLMDADPPDAPAMLELLITVEALTGWCAEHLTSAEKTELIALLTDPKAQFANRAVEVLARRIVAALE